jgi:hypothetical protein
VAAHGSVTQFCVVRAAFVRVALERSAAFDESEDSVHPAIDRAYRTRLAGHSDAYVRRRPGSSAAPILTSSSPVHPVVCIASKSVLAGISLNKPAFAGSWEYPP